MLKTKDGIPKLTITRLAIYYNALKKMLEDGEDVCLSIDVGKRTGINPSLIRKDLSYFGGFGTKGVGYKVEFLMEWIGEILGYNTVWNTVVVGMGIPLLSINCYQNLLPPSFRIVAVVDTNEQNHGVFLPELGLTIEPVQNLESEVRNKQARIGVVAVLPEKAQSVTNQLVIAGVTGIANFTQVQVVVPDNIALTQINTGSLLSQLSYDLVRPMPALRSIV